MFSSFSSTFSSTFSSAFSLPDLRQVLHAQLSSAVGHLFDLETLSQEQFDVRISGLSSILTLRDVALNPGVRIGGGEGASPAAAATSVIIQTLAGGRIGHFSVSIPLSTLVRKTRPIEIYLRDVEIVLGMEDAVDAEVARACWEAEKRRLVAQEVEREKMRDRERKSEEEREREGGRDQQPQGDRSETGGYLFESLFKRLIGLGVSRLRLDVQRVRVRIVDMKTGDDVAACRLDRMLTVDEGDHGYDIPVGPDRMIGIPSPISQIVEGLMRHGSPKMLRVQGAGVQWCGETTAAEKKTYASLDCTLHAFYSLTSSPSQVMFRVRFDSVEAGIDMHDVADVLALIEDLEWRAVRRRVAHLKSPIEPVSLPCSVTLEESKFDAREMWRFAINSVLFEIVGPVRFSLWRPEEQVLRDRRRYILLYRKMNDVRSSMSAVGERELARLEGLLSAGDVVACRTVAMRNGKRDANQIDSRNAGKCSTAEYFIAKDCSGAAEGLRPDDDGGATAKTSEHNPKSSVLWSKIPALVDMEEQLFQALEIDSQEDWFAQQSEGPTPSSQSPSSSKLQVVALVQVPRATARVKSKNTGLDAAIVLSDAFFGYVDDVSDDIDVSSMPPHSPAPTLSAAYVSASLRRLEVSTSRDTIISFNSPLTVEYLGMNNVIRVEMVRGMDARVAPQDIRALVDSIPVASPESYSMHWVETAISMEKKAYCIETVRRLQRLGNFVDFDVRVGGIALTIEGLDIRIFLDTLVLHTSMESENFDELRNIYRIISSFDAASDVAANDNASAKSAMQMLEERLIYKEIDVTLGNLRVNHGDTPVVYPLQGTAKAKINRLYGDFSHPQVAAEFAFGEVSVDMFDACLSSFIELQKALEFSEGMPEDSWRIQRTISVGIGWPSLCIRWLAGDDVVRHQFSIHSGPSSVGARVSFPHSISSDVSFAVRDFKVLHSKGMESIKIPLVDVQIPYFARSFSLDRLAFDMKDRPNALEVSFESTGILLTGDRKDTSNYIRSTTTTDASIRTSFVQREGEPAALKAFVSNIDIGHGTLMRAFVLSQILGEDGASQQTQALSSESMQLCVDLVVQNIRCSFVHDMMYGTVLGTPVQYHDFSAIQSTVAQVRLSRLDLQCDVGNQSAIRLLELDSLTTTCGILRERGAVLGVTFDLPQIRCYIGDIETLLDCPEINGGFSPYQVALLKGIADLIGFDQSRYTSFYRELHEPSNYHRQSSNLKLDAPQQPQDGEIATVLPAFDGSSVNFDPVRVLIGSVNVCAIGSVPSAGSMWLCGRSIELGGRPGDVRLVWQKFEISHWCDAEYSAAYGAGSAAGSRSGSSDGDGSAVVYHDVGRATTSSSSVFFDAASMVSRGVSESSFMTSFYSADEDADGSDESLWDQDDVVRTAPPLPEEGDLVSLLRVSFDNQVDMGAVLSMVTNRHLVLSLSPVMVNVGLDALAGAVHFVRTFERYLFNHILSDPCCSPQDTTSVRKVAEGSSPPFQELLVEVDRLTVVIETREDTENVNDDVVSRRSYEADYGRLTSSDQPKHALRHAISIALGAQLKYAGSVTDQVCSFDVRGLFASSFSHKGNSSNVDDSFLESHALLGNESCSIKGRWSPDMIDCDIRCTRVSAWLTELNLAPIIQVISKCHDSIEDMNDGGAATKGTSCLDDLTKGGTLPDDPVAHENLFSGTKSATLDVSMQGLSVVLAAHALSGQKKHLCEVDINHVSVGASCKGGVFSTSGSLSIEAGACRVSDGSFISMLDETNVVVDALGPLDMDVAASPEGLTRKDTSNSVTVTVGVSQSDFTVNRDVVESLSLCSMLVDGLRSSNKASTLAAYLTTYQLVNETSCRLSVNIYNDTEEEPSVHLLEPGASMFPPQAPSLPYKAWTPDAKHGAKELDPSQRASMPAVVSHCASICIDKEVGRHVSESSAPGVNIPVGFGGTDRTRSAEVSISLETENTLYRSFKDFEIVFHTSRSSSGTWTTRIRPCIRFRNNTDMCFEVAKPGSSEVLATAESGQEVWLPLSASFGDYILRANDSDWSDSLWLSRNMASQGSVQHTDAIFRTGVSVISVPLTISGNDGSVCLTASPKLDIFNLMPIPVDWNFHPSAPPSTLQPGERISVPNSWCNFPLVLDFSPMGFSDVRRVYLNEINGVPVLKWEKGGWNDYVNALDVIFGEKSSGVGELYGRLTVSKDAVAGTVIITIVSPVWVLNHTGVPISFDCLMESALPGTESSSAVANDVDSPAAVDEFEDLIPDIWIPPLESNPSIGLDSTPTIHSQEDLSVRNRANNPVEACQGLASISPAMSTDLGRRNSLEVETISILSPGASLAYNVAGLGSLVAHTPHSPLEGYDAEAVGSTRSLLGRSRAAERFNMINEAPIHISGSANPSGLNARGVHVMSQAVKRFRLRVTRQKARTGSSHWSLPVSLDTHRRRDVALIPLPPVTTGMHLYNTRQGEFPVVVSLQQDGSMAPGVSVDVLSVSPQFVMSNELGTDIVYRQQGAYIETRIPTGQSSAIQWTDIGLPRKVSVRIHEAGWMWSGAFSLENAGDMFLKLRHRDRGVTHVVRADILPSLEDGTKQIVLRSNPGSFTPYRLDNCSLETLTIRQKGVADQQDVLRPYCSLNYAWDEPSIAHKITMERPGGQVIGCFDFDKVGFQEKISFKKGFGSGTAIGSSRKLMLLGDRDDTSSDLVVRVTAEGPVRVLTIMDLGYHEINPLKDEADKLGVQESKDFELCCNFDSLSLSIIHLRRERLYFGIQKVRTSCVISSSRMAVSGSIRYMSLENTSRSCVYPVIFSLPAPESTVSSRLMKGVGESDAARWEFTLWRDFRGLRNIACFDQMDIYVRSFSVYIEQDLINLFMDMSASSDWTLPSTHRGAPHSRDNSAGFVLNKDPNGSQSPRSLAEIPPLRQPTSPKTARPMPTNTKFYFDRISVSPVEFLISFNSSVAEDLNDWSGVLLQQVIALADIEDARIWLSGIRLSNTLFDQDTMVSYVSTHYKRAFILEIFKLLGAANVLGDPMATIHHIGLGFWEFVSFPAVGLVQSCKTLSPTYFVLGCVQGTKGLLQNVLFAVSNATTKASSAARKTIRLTWGDDRGSNPKESLLGATLRGMIGMVTEPVKGAEVGGISGFLLGIRHGAFGAVLIPASALLEMCASLALSVRKAVAGTANIGWTRPPRANDLLPYDWTDSMGQWLFGQLNAQQIGADVVKIADTSDQYVCCSRLSNATDGSLYLILTTKRVLVARAEGLNWTPTVVWSSTLAMLEVVTSADAGETSTLRLVANPGLVGSQGMRRREERKLFSVFEGDFVLEQEAGHFRRELDICRNNVRRTWPFDTSSRFQLQSIFSSSIVYL